MNDRAGQKSDNIDQDLTVNIAFTQVWIPLLHYTQPQTLLTLSHRHFQCHFVFQEKCLLFGIT